MPDLMTELHAPAPRKDDRQVLSFQKSGYLILIGQNAYSNERLVAEHPHRDCLWMHAMAARGSHLVLCTHDKDAPASDVLQYAAGLALKYSHSEARSVSVALLKNLSKDDDAGIGVFKAESPMTLDVESPA